VARCWGFGLHGELGSGRAETRGTDAALPPIPVKLDSPVESIVAGGSHTCAILAGGRVKCWGANAHGQLGLGDTEDRGDDPGEMESLPDVDLGGGKAVRLALGRQHTCALMRHGVVRCWGNNSTYQLGIGDTVARGDDPGEMGDAMLDLGFGSAPTAIGASGNVSCGLPESGRARCWGPNLAGLERFSPTPDELKTLSLPSTLTGITVGNAHACGWNRSDGVLCWGESRAGQLGLLDYESTSNWVDLGAAAEPSRVSAGATHTCAVLGGRLKCWGLNLFGALGIGDARLVVGDQPSEMGDDLPFVELGDHEVTAVSGGDGFTCAVLDDSGVKCWGRNESGQLGQGDTLHRGSTPEQMEELEFVPLDGQAQ
jgi:alpha-tubulin suppressor-like RCC1 family protein